MFHTDELRVEHAPQDVLGLKGDMIGGFVIGDVVSEERKHIAYGRGAYSIYTYDAQEFGGENG